MVEELVLDLMAEGEESLLDLDLGEGEAEPAEEGAEPGAKAAEGAAGGESAEAGEAADKIDGRRGSKEFREWLKTQEATPEGSKFAKTAREDHFRVAELAKLEPGGITALRDKYALLESVGGPEAITQMQERVGAAEATDAALASGDAKVFESMGKAFDAGLAKLAPAYLDRVMKSDPEAYAAAILPHLMNGLSGSPMVSDLNTMVDVLQSTHLDEASKLKQVTGLLGRIGAWFQHNEKKAGEAKTPPVDTARTALDQERTKFDQEQQQAHWSLKIAPAVGSYEKGKLEELFKPFDTRLKLDAAAKADLFATFTAKMAEAAKSDQAYMKQMAIYRKQKNPDPAVVTNFVKAAVNRHSKAVVETAVKARYGRFLGGAAGKAKPVAVAGARAATVTPGAAPVVVSVRPSPDEIDYSRTSEDDQWKGIFTLKTGKRVKVSK